MYNKSALLQGKSLGLNREQVITWTNGDPDQWWVYAWLSFDMLSQDSAKLPAEWFSFKWTQTVLKSVLSLYSKKL